MSLLLTLEKLVRFAKKVSKQTGKKITQRVVLVHFGM